MLQRKFVIWTLVALLCLVATIVAQAPQGPGGQRGPGGGGRGGAGGGAPAIKMVKPGIYMVTGAGGNSVVRVTNDGIVVVDTKNPGEANYNGLMDQIKTVSMQPVKYVVVTHIHSDHSGNVEAFLKSGAQVVVHENFIKNIDTYTGAKPAKPNVTYAKDYSIKLGSAEVAHVYHFDSGHTSGDSIVYFPDVGVVAMGDELSTNTNCDYPQGGSIPGWAKSLDAVLKLNFDTAIAGHGNDPMTKADLQTLKTKMDSITKNAIELVKKGTPKDQLVAQIQAADANATVGAVLQNNAGRIDLFFEEISKMAK
jgi:glyoxylase-like metal-dependent hydrolase (beta-lactamase superfamily II)